jgi:hypothetical protein
MWQANTRPVSHPPSDWLVLPREGIARRRDDLARLLIFFAIDESTAAFALSSPRVPLLLMCFQRGNLWPVRRTSQQRLLLFESMQRLSPQAFQAKIFTTI